VTPGANRHGLAARRPALSIHLATARRLLAEARAIRRLGALERDRSAVVLREAARVQRGLRGLIAGRGLS
jgi:hypothetical protein